MKKLSTFILFLSAFSFAYSASETKAPKFIQALDKGSPQQIVAFGTSLTRGSQNREGGAWLLQLKELLDKNYPGLVTIVNEGGGGSTSKWGLTEIDRVIAENSKANAIFIEFAINDAVTRYNRTPKQTQKNIEGMIAKIQKRLPNCEIILQITHPAIGIPMDNKSARSNQEAHQQVYRELAKKHNLLLIDNTPAVKAYVDKNGEEAFKANYAKDGVQINKQGAQDLYRSTLVKALHLKKE